MKQIATLGPDIDTWRSDQFQLLSGLRSKVQPLALALNEARSAPSVKCAAHVDPAANMLAAFAIGWPDERLDDLICNGASPMGLQEPAGI